MQRLTAWSSYIGALGVAMFVVAALLFLISDIARNVLLLMGGIGIVLVAFYFIVRPRDEMRQASNVRIASRGAMALLIAAVIIGILVALNYLANTQFNQRFDVTANRAHTLSPQTVQVLQALTDTVKVTGFFTADTLEQRQRAENLLQDYQAQSNKLAVQYVDPDENPALAQKYENALSGSLVFENSSGDRTEKVYSIDESAFTNALLKVTQTKKPVVYFASGHGEYATDDFEANGMGVVADLLTQVNYQVEPLNLLTISDTLPADTSVLIIAGPTKPFSAASEKLVADYLNRGGRVLILADPNTSIGMTDTLKTWGLVLANNLVLDPARNYLGNTPIPVFTQFPVSPITTNLERLGVFFPGARSISETVTTGKDPTPLFTTTQDACAKNDFEKLQGQQEINCQDGDATGPFELGYAVEQRGAAENANARLIVIGNASFALNRWLNSQDGLGNQQLFLNMMQWLVGQEQLVSIPSRDPDMRPLTALSGADVNMIAGTSMLLIPLVALIIGGLLWWKKR